MNIAFDLAETIDASTGVPKAPMSVNLTMAKTIRPAPPGKLSVAQRHASLWKCGLAFFFGFCMEFNMLTGIGGEVASSSGLYGFRLLDFASFGGVGFLGFYSLIPRHTLSVFLYALFAAILFSPQLLSYDPQTTTLAYRYMLYSLAALYVVVVIDEVRALEWLCWGLIVGLVATVPIFVVQDSVYNSTLIDWGLTPRYAQVVYWGPDFVRYSGLTTHPNEAGHIAALSAAAGAYFAFARRRFLPIVIVSAGLLAVFYYTRCRAGIFVGGATVLLSLLLVLGRLTFARFTVVVLVGIVSLALVSQIDFIASRFTDDPYSANNITERLDTTLSGLHTLLAHPFGLGVNEFNSIVWSETGLPTPHDGFIFFGGVFGLLALSALLVVFAASLRARNDTDMFFVFLTLQVSLSFLFEQLSGSNSFAFATCLIAGHFYLRTRFGGELVVRTPARIFLSYVR